MNYKYLNMKTYFLFFLALLTLQSCKKNEAKNELNKVVKTENIKTQKETDIPTDTIVAMKFINEYCDFCNKQFNEHKIINPRKFIEKNELLTESFKKSYKELFETAEKDDPEIGLDFDPIFDAQDFPENGFELLKIEKNGYLIVRAKGSEWSNFKIKLKVSSYANKWLVDGASVINIPSNLREKR